MSLQTPPATSAHVTPSADWSYPCMCALKSCKTSQLRSDLSPARANSSLCWEDDEEMPLSSFSHLRRTEKSDVPFLEHRPHKHLQKHPSPGITTLSPCCPASCTDGKTMHSSCHLISLFDGINFSEALPHGGNGLFPGNFSWFFFFQFLE